MKATRWDAGEGRTVSAEELASIRIDATIERASVADAVRRLVAESGVDIGTPGIDVTSKISSGFLRAQAMPLPTALDAVLAGTGLAWRIDGSRVEIMGGETSPPPAMKARYFDVGDLMVHAKADVQPGFHDVARSRNYEPVPENDHLDEEIRREVKPGFWSTSGATLEIKNHILIARATPDVHRAIEDWLRERRLAPPKAEPPPSSPTIPPTDQGAQK